MPCVMRNVYKDIHTLFLDSYNVMMVILTVMIVSSTLQNINLLNLYFLSRLVKLHLPRTIHQHLVKKVTYSRLYNFFHSLNVIYDKQFGFRNNHSTTHAMNFVTITQPHMQ